MFITGNEMTWCHAGELVAARCEDQENNQSISQHFSVFHGISERPELHITQTRWENFDPVTWLSSSKSLIMRCSSFPQTRFSGSNVTFDMTLADEKFRFGTIFDHFRHSLVTCLSVMDGAWYTSHVPYHIIYDTNDTNSISWCGILVRRHNVIGMPNHFAYMFESNEGTSW